MARVCLTTEYTEHTERHSSAVSREGAKTRRLEGECPHEPPSTARKDGFRVYCGAPGGASVCLPADEQTLVPPWRRSRRHPVKKSLRLCVLCVKKLSTLNSHFGTHKSGERFGVRRQAVFRATPLFEQCFSARGAKGKRCRDPRTARLLSPHSKFSAAPCAAQPLCARAAGNHVNPVKKTSCFSAETHDPRTPLSLTDYLPLTLRMDY